MPVAVSYPGVYVQPIIQPSPPDTGVATSLAAFIGRASMGPVNQPVLLNNWGDFQRAFGGLSEDSSVSYQVQAFFNNGGGQAVAVRLFEPGASDAAIGSAADDLIDGAKSAADGLYANNANPPKADVVKAVDGYFQTQADLGGLNGSLAGFLGTHWDAAATGLADPPGQTAVDAAVAGLSALQLSFIATITINPLNSVAAAVHELTEVLADKAAMAATSPPSLMMLNLAVADVVNDHLTDPIGSVALRTIQAQMVHGADFAGRVALAYASIPLAYQQAVPALQNTSDQTFGAIAGDAAAGVAAMEALVGANNANLAAIAAAQTALRASRQAGATPATVKDALDAWITPQNLGNDSGVQAVKAAVEAQSVASVADAQNAAVGVVTGFLSAATGNAKTWAEDAIKSAASAPGQPDLVLAASQGIADGLVGDWPAAGSLILSAASPGAWGNRVVAAIDNNGITPQVAAARGVAAADIGQLFNLTVTYTDFNGLQTIEAFNCVTLSATYPTLQLGGVLAQQAQFVRQKSTGTLAPSPGSSGKGGGGGDSWPLALTTYLGDENQKTGIYALERTPIFNILCIPPDDVSGDTNPLIYQTAAEYCVARQAMLIIDPPAIWSDHYKAGAVSRISLNELGSFGADPGRSAAVYFPRVQAADPLRNGQVRVFPNSGYMAGLWAQTDVQSGVWKAPAGLSAAIDGITGLEIVMNDAENGMLNPYGINCLRTFPIGGSVVWGARTLRGADQLADQYNYIPVRRMLLYIWDWVMQNTKWAVFQDNDSNLWSSLRLQISNMLTDLWRQGALFGQAANQAFFVKCDATTTSTADINAGRVNVQIGFAPVRPAEFVIVTIQQVTGQTS